MADYNVRLAYKEDLRGMHNVENLSFSNPWSYEAFKENFFNLFSVYVLAENEYGEIVGFGGMQVIFEEAHIMNIAVLEQCRRKGIAGNLLELMMIQARERDAQTMFLEVRESNIPAQTLYKKYGFTEITIRKNYYSDNGENAIIMAVEL